MKGKTCIVTGTTSGIDESYDPAVAARLWKVSEELTAAPDVP